MSPWKRLASPTATAGIAATLFAAAWVTAHDTRMPAALESNIRFEATELVPADNGNPMKHIRAVHPKLTHLDAWISSVGAAVALGDIAGSGRPADICLVDPRNDSVTVMPVPGTGDRYRSFALKLPAGPHNPVTVAPMGCVLADMNEDGHTDLLVYFWGRPPVAFIQTGSAPLGASSFNAVDIAPAVERWFTNAVAFADVDGDGHVDIIVGNYFRDGDRILDATATEGGEMQHSMSRAENAGRNRLLLWKEAVSGRVEYRDASAALSDEMANGWTLAIGAVDLDGDLLPEIYIANDFGNDRLLHNLSVPGKPRFAIVEGVRDLSTTRSRVLGRDSFKGMGVDFGNVSADGRFAIAVSNIAQPYALLESNFLFLPSGRNGGWQEGVAPYRDESGPRGTSISGWAWDIKFADLDNSSRPSLLQAIGFLKGEQNRWPELQELAMGNDELLKFPAFWPRLRLGDDLSGNDHDRLFYQKPDGTFVDVARQAGLPVGTVSRGIATADVFGDGRLSVAIARQWMPSTFLRNVTPAVGSFLALDLRVSPNHEAWIPAIGATARVRLPDGRVLVDRIDGGSGHSGKRASQIHLGLGDISPAHELPVELSWRDKTGMQLATVWLKPGRHRIELRQGIALAADENTKEVKEASNGLDR